MFAPSDHFLYAEGEALPHDVDVQTVRETLTRGSACPAPVSGAEHGTLLSDRTALDTLSNAVYETPFAFALDKPLNGPGVTFFEVLSPTCYVVPAIEIIDARVWPALAAGCPIIVRPADATPLSALALAALAQRAGVPKGIFSVITGSSRAIGAELTSNPTIRKLSFTGSTPVGSMLMAQCAPTIKKLSLESGGNAPSSFSTMPISTKQLRGRWHPSFAIVAKRAFVPIGSTSTMPCTMSSPPNSAAQSKI